MSATRDRHNPRVLGAFERLEQQIGQQKIPDVIEGKGHFETIFADLAFTVKRARVVDQHIQARVFRREVRGKLANTRHAREVTQHQLEFGLRYGLTDFFEFGTTFCLISSHHQNGRAHFCQFTCRDKADSVGRACYEHCLASHRIHGCILTCCSLNESGTTHH